MLGQVLNRTSFHDGYLTSVAVGKETATFGLRQSSGRQFELVLGGVEALCIDDFREGNIISDLTAVSGREPTSQETDVLIKLFFHEAGPEIIRSEFHAEFWDGRLQRLRNGTAVLVMLESSYGADMAAYCDAAELAERS